MFHSANRLKSEAPILKVNAILRKNRSILKTLCPKGKATVRREVLDAMGYDFAVFSSVFTTKRGLYYICYDFAFSPILESGTEKALIVTYQDYMANGDPWKPIWNSLQADELKHFL